jgi:hypothetical protein
MSEHIPDEQVPETQADAGANKARIDTAILVSIYFKEYYSKLGLH